MTDFLQNAIPEERELVPSVARTLVLNGYQIVEPHRSTNFFLFRTEKLDKFGAYVRYHFVVTNSYFSKTDLAVVQRFAREEGGILVLIGESFDSDNQTSLSVERFFSCLGGRIKSYAVFQENFCTELRQLAFNQMPQGLAGMASDNFEVYVGRALEFVFNERVVLFGRKRSGKELPDGFITGSVLSLYDAKAAKEHYEFSTDSMRQFAKYVEDFRDRYEAYRLRLSSFLVISGSFESREIVRSRSQDLYSRCNLKMVCVDVENLIAIIKLFIDEPYFRNALDWRRLLAEDYLTAKSVEENLRERRKDSIVTGGV